MLPKLCYITKKENKTKLKTSKKNFKKLKETNENFTHTHIHTMNIPHVCKKYHHFVGHSLLLCKLEKNKKHM